MNIAFATDATPCIRSVMRKVKLMACLPLPGNPDKRKLYPRIHKPDSWNRRSVFQEVFLCKSYGQMLDIDIWLAKRATTP